MAIVRELMNRTSSVMVWVTYDNDIMTVEFSEGRTVITFINGYYVIPSDTGIEITRTGRQNYFVGDIQNNINVGDGYVIEDDKLVYFAINLGLSNNNEMVITSTKTQSEPDTEPEPEPEPPVKPEPEPELVSLKIPRYRDDSDYKYLIEDGSITVKINGEIASDTKNIVVPKYSEFAIEIINNQLNKQFDYDRIEFTLDKRQPNGDYISIDISPDIKTPDKMVFNVNASNWEDYIGKGDNTIYTPNALIYLYFTGKEVKPVEDYPFLNIYKVDDKSLNTLAKEVNEKRYKQETDNSGGVSPSYDIMGNILDLVRIPYAIQTEPELEYIKLNNEAMESQGYQILNYIQEVNLGKIHCYHDTLVNIGYKNIGFNLFVPNFKPIELDVAKVIDRTIEMKLNLDLTTGQGTLNLLMDGIAFHVEQEKISKDIPFKSDSINVSLNDNVLNTKYLNPYLEIIVLNPDNTINTQELKQRKINKSSLLYAKSDNIILNSKATYNEQLEIEMLLRKGVYVNG